MSDDLEAMFNALDTGHDVREVYEKGPLNYLGNKYGCLHSILPHLPYTDKWIDVFGGSGAVTIARKRSKFEVYNDRHSGLVSFYKCIQDPDRLDRLISTIELMPHSRELFIYSKETYEQDKDDVMRAAKYYYMVQCSFNGRGQYFGRDLGGKNSVWKKIHENLSMFSTLHSRFENVLIENLDWRTCFKDFDSRDAVFYLDPPYIDGNFYQHNMSKKDHIEMCQRIFQLEGFVALSGYENAIYDAFPWTGVHQVMVSNRVNTMSFDDNNNMAGREGTVDRSDRIEYLYIKEADE